MVCFMVALFYYKDTGQYSHFYKKFIVYSNNGLITHICIYGFVV